MKSTGPYIGYIGCTHEIQKMVNKSFFFEKFQLFSWLFDVLDFNFFLIFLKKNLDFFGEGRKGENKIKNIEHTFFFSKKFNFLSLFSFLYFLRIFRLFVSKVCIRQFFSFFSFLALELVRSQPRGPPMARCSPFLPSAYAASARNREGPVGGT